MANTITPMTTNLAASGKQLKLTSQIEFDLGRHDADRLPLIDLLAEEIAFNQMIPFQVDVAADEKGFNLWEAPEEALRARAIIVVCLYGAGGILINPDGNPLPFPLATADAANPAWFLYVNPEGTGLTVDVDGSPTATGPGIQKVTVDTEHEARFQGYVFI
jgi:hypothetical protein